MLSMHRQSILSFLLVLFSVLAFSAPVFAHAFGARHQLDVPLYYYVLGAGLTVLLSFLVTIWLVRRRPAGDATRALLVLDGEGRFHTLMSGARWLVAAGGVFLFLLILSTGLWGADSPTRNFAPIFVWSLWWVGVVYLQALGMDVWRVANPWARLFGGLCRLLRRDADGAILPYPVRWSCWPAVVLFWGFVWLEQVAPFGEDPRSLTIIIAAYSLFTWTGMLVFGRRRWLENGEVFSILFSYIAAMAPLILRPRTEGAAKSLWLRPPVIGLLERRNLDNAAVALLLLLLASVTFDGFRDTLTWAGIVDWALTRSWLYRPLFWVQRQGVDLYLFLETLGLLITPLLFFFSFSLISLFSAGMTRGQMTGRDFAGTFVLTLLPISLAYHIAHYLTFLLLAGQLAIPVISDPYNLGWDLFGTGARQLNIGIIGISTTWWVAMFAVILGHIYAVYLAHAAAIRALGQPRIAILSQSPLVSLMIGYTMLSLWILAQPIVAAD